MPTRRNSKQAASSDLSSDSHLDFQALAKDSVTGTYLSYCIHYRIPFVYMLISTMRLTIFLLLPAWSEWPSA